jgi:hypothetical protein
MAEIKDNPIINHIAANAQAQAQNTQTSVDIAKMMDQQEEQSQAAIVARSAIGNADQTILSSRHSRAAAVDAKNAAIRTEFGADPTLQGTASNNWIREAEANAQKAYAALDVVKQKQSTTLLDDPIGFISAQFTLPADVAAYNYYANKHNIAQSRVSEITQSSDANVIAANRAAATTSTEEAIAEGEKAALGAAMDIAKLKEAAAGSRIKGLGELNALTRDQANMAMQLHQSANSDRGLALQEQAHRDLLEDRALRRQQAASQLKDKQDSFEDQESLRLAYNMGAKATGRVQIPDARSWRTTNAALQKDPLFWETMGYGQQLQLTEGVTNGIPVANSAGNTAMLYASGRVPAGNNVAQFLVDRVAEVKLEPNAPKDKEGFAAAVTIHAQARAKTMSTRIDPKVPNIYSAPPVGVVMQAVGLADDPFLTTMVKPILVEEPNAKIPDDVLFAKAADFVAGNRANFNAAADGIATYYKIAVLKNNIANQYSEKGLPNQKAYNAVINGRTVNLIDVISIKRELMIQDMLRTGRSITSQDYKGVN